MLAMLLLAITGFCISVYSFIIEKKISANPNYKPVCDLSDRVSCTKPMRSEYASIFYFSNSIIGAAYYLMLIALILLQMHGLLFFATVCAVVVSAFLAFLLYFKVKAVCLLCTSLYIINILLLILAIRYR